VRYCDFWEFKNEDDNFAQHADATMIQVDVVALLPQMIMLKITMSIAILLTTRQEMLRPTVEELVRVKDVDVQMREFLANLRVTVEAGQKGKKKKAKKKPKKKKEKKGKKKKDPTEGRSMERCASLLSSRLSLSPSSVARSNACAASTASL
jgi:hypothetical protein